MFRSSERYRGGPLPGLVLRGCSASRCRFDVQVWPGDSGSTMDSTHNFRFAYSAHELTNNIHMHQSVPVGVYNREHDVSGPLLSQRFAEGESSITVGEKLSEGIADQTWKNTSNSLWTGRYGTCDHSLRSPGLAPNVSLHGRSTPHTKSQAVS